MTLKYLKILKKPHNFILSKSKPQLEKHSINRWTISRANVIASLEGVCEWHNTSISRRTKLPWRPIAIDSSPESRLNRTNYNYIRFPGILAPEYLLQGARITKNRFEKLGKVWNIEGRHRTFFWSARYSKNSLVGGWSTLRLCFADLPEP